jgi:hypothetical protein
MHAARPNTGHDTSTIHSLPALPFAMTGRKVAGTMYPNPKNP